MSLTAIRRAVEEIDDSEVDERHRRGLTALPAWRPRSGPKLIHGFIAMTGLIGIIIAQLTMSVGLTDSALQLQTLQSESAAAERTQQALTEELSALQSPQNLSLEAETLGMVAGEPAQYLSLATGALTAGADNIAMSPNATSPGGSLYVPHEFVQSEAGIATVTERDAMAAQREREREGYPGMLEPAAGVATDG